MKAYHLNHWLLCLYEFKYLQYSVTLLSRGWNKFFGVFSDLDLYIYRYKHIYLTRIAFQPASLLCSEGNEAVPTDCDPAGELKARDGAVLLWAVNCRSVCSAGLCSTLQYIVGQCSTVHCSAGLCSAQHFSVVWCSVVQCSAVQCNTLWDISLQLGPHIEAQQMLVLAVDGR